MQLKTVQSAGIQVMELFAGCAERAWLIPSRLRVAKTAEQGILMLPFAHTAAIL